MFPTIFRIYSKLTTIITAIGPIVHVTHNLFELLWVKTNQFIKHSPTLDRWLGILVKFQPMCLVYVLKTLPNYIYSEIICHKSD